MRATISLVAREAGVSTATVDRVLNGRGGVSTRTGELVERAARQVGWYGAREGDVRPVRLDFVLPAGENDFMADLRKFLFEEAAARHGVEINVHQIEGFNHDKLSERLMELRGRTDAVGLVALDHPNVREAVNSLVESGVHVGTLVSDIPNTRKVGYVGVDNRAAGRLAGLLMGRFLPPGGERRVAVFIGSPAYRGHEEREMGFRSIIAEDFPNLRIAHIAEVREDRERAFTETRHLLAGGGIDGIYNIGGGRLGVARALREAHREQKVVFIGHDLTEATKLMLLDRTMDALIDQNPRVEAREIITLLISAVKGSKEREYLPRLQVVFRENIPYV